MPSLVEIGQVVLEKRIYLMLWMYILLFCNNLGKGRGPSFEQSWILFTQGCFVSSLIEIDPVVLEKKMTVWKVYENANNNANDDNNQGQILIRQAFCLGELLIRE